jgi:hypothetical protein
MEQFLSKKILSSECCESKKYTILLSANLHLLSDIRKQHLRLLIQKIQIQKREKDLNQIIINKKSIRKEIKKGVDDIEVVVKNVKRKIHHEMKKILKNLKNLLQKNRTIIAKFHLKRKSV